MRTLCGFLLIAAVGCGGKDNPPPADPTPAVPPAKTTDPVAPQPAPAPVEDKKTTPEPPKTPPAPPVAWELDPAKHAVPAAAAAGSVAKAPFAPLADFQTDTLTFRTFTKDGNLDRLLAVKLAPEQARAAADGVKLVVRPEDAAGAKVPVVSVEMPGEKKDTLKVIEYPSGYALTLDLGKRDKGALPGKVFLSLPGDEKDFLAGTFTADWVRPVADPPGADDAPFVQGAVTVAGATAATKVRVGYVGTPKAGEFALDSIEMQFVSKGQHGRAEQAKPRVTTLVSADAPDKAGRYEHVRLPAGKYLVFAEAVGGPPVGKWVAVPADGKVTVDFALDPAKAGKLEVKVPAGAMGKVLVVPADEGGVAVEVFGAAASILGTQADVAAGAARFDRLAPGRYEVRLNEFTATAEVKANENSVVELGAAKK